jgi:TatA/E family protein of Tat protein translocase
MEIIIVLALALLIFGPKRLPEMGRTLGRAAREFRKATDEVKGVFNLNLNDDDQAAGGGAAAAVTAAVPPQTPGIGPWSPDDVAGRNDYAPATERAGAEALPGLAGFLGVAHVEQEAAVAAVPTAPAFASFLGASAATSDAEAGAPAVEGADDRALVADAPAGADVPALAVAEAVVGPDARSGPEAPATAETG